MDIRSNEQLIEFLAQGNSAKFVFFWGHQAPKTGTSKSCFSQWFESSFEENRVTFKKAEHYMMYYKAMTFENEDIAKKILNSEHPAEAKKLGREVIGFDEERWNKERFAIVVQANLLKFSQNPALTEFLCSTGKRILVEASPVDTVWGVGMAADDEAILSPQNWKGLNLLGYALMEVRSQLSEQKKLGERT